MILRNNFGLFMISPTFLSKHLWTTNAIPRWYPPYFGLLAILNALSRNTLPDAVFLCIYLKSYDIKIRLLVVHFDWYTWRFLLLCIVLFLFYFLNGPKALYVSLFCLRCILGMRVSSTNKNLLMTLIIIIHLKQNITQ